MRPERLGHHRRKAIGPAPERVWQRNRPGDEAAVDRRGRDDAGKPYLMEINPRLNLGIEFAVRAGVDFPYLLYQWANGDRIDHIEGYRVGGWMRFLAGDIMTTIQAVQQRGRPGVSPPARAILDFCTSFFIPMSYDYLDWRDPLPAFIATTNFTRSWVGGAIKKRLSRLKKFS